MSKKYCVLVVDDIESIRFAIKDYLENVFDVREADNGYSAIKVMESCPVDIVITDIRMPGMGGLDLIRYLSSDWPAVKYILMTAYNVNDYIQFAREEKIWNIIPKTTFLDLRHIRIMIEKILSGDIFGIEKYFPGLSVEKITFPDLYKMARKIPEETLNPGILYSVQVGTMEEKDRVCEIAGNLLLRSGAPRIFRQVVEELATNAMLRAPRNPHGKPKYHFRVSSSDTLIPLDHIVLEPEDKFDLAFGIVSDQAVVCVTDYHGTLDREEILYRLERQISVDPKTRLPIGVGDSHGRGLFISREHTDYLIFNIEPKKRTEAIAILSVDSSIRNRSLSIFQTNG